MKFTGNDAAERSSVEPVRQRLVRYAVKLVWNRDDADEIVQEAFRIALTRGVAVTGSESLPWLLRTTGNLCLNARRRRRPVRLDEAAVATLTSPGEQPPDAESLERLRAAIESLPAQQRDALVMRAMEQMGYEEIAAAMELSVGAVRAHVHLARRALMKMLGSNDA